MIDSIGSLLTNVPWWLVVLVVFGYALISDHIDNVNNDDDVEDEEPEVVEEYVPEFSYIIDPESIDNRRYRANLVRSACDEFREMPRDEESQHRARTLLEEWREQRRLDKLELARTEHMLDQLDDSLEYAWLEARRVHAHSVVPATSQL
jgi:hypothetical protein